MSKATPLLDAIKSQHQWLTELFTLAQEALIEKQCKLAFDIFATFSKVQQTHLSFENNHLLPKLALVEDCKWPHTLYLHEHNKIEQLLAKALANIKLGYHLNGSEYRRWLIATLDDQKTLKGVLEHHEAREEQGMLQELELNLDVTQIEGLCQTLLTKTENEIKKEDAQYNEWLNKMP